MSAWQHMAVTVRLDGPGLSPIGDVIEVDGFPRSGNVDWEAFLKEKEAKGWEIAAASVSFHPTLRKHYMIVFLKQPNHGTHPIQK